MPGAGGAEVADRPPDRSRQGPRAMDAKEPRTNSNDKAGQQDQDNDHPVRCWIFSGPSAHRPRRRTGRPSGARQWAPAAGHRSSAPEAVLASALFDLFADVVGPATVIGRAPAPDRHPVRPDETPPALGTLDLDHRLSLRKRFSPSFSAVLRTIRRGGFQGKRSASIILLIVSRNWYIKFHLFATRPNRCAGGASTFGFAGSGT